MDHLVTEFSFGGLPHEEAEVNMRRFADRVMPILQRDPVFAAPPAEGPLSVLTSGEKERLFAPA